MTGTILEFGGTLAKRRRLMAVEGPNAEIAGATVLMLPLLPRTHGGRAPGGTLAQRLGWVPVGTLGHIACVSNLPPG